MAQGVFLSLDGLDGTGKSTQCRLLAERLRSEGYAVTTCADPGGTPVGDKLRRMLLHGREEMTPACQALLFMASRAQLTETVIRPALLAGGVVVSDRFLLANVVYQGHAGGLDFDQLWQVGRFATGGLEPDLSVVLDLPVEQAAARRVAPADRIEGQGEAYHLRVRLGFLEEAKRHADRMRVVDAGRSVYEVHEDVWKAVAGVLADGPRPD
jgi:dTMP kinase